MLVRGSGPRLPTRVGNKQTGRCAQGCAQQSAAPRGAPTAPPGRSLLLRRTGGRCPSVRCPSGVLPQTASPPPSRAAPRKAELSAPRCHCSCPLLPSSATALRGKRASPKSRRPRNEPRSPVGCPPQQEPGVPAGGRDWRTDRGKQREGEETQPREHVKSLREGRWKITLALSRPVLLCAARRAIFLRS